MSLMKRLNYDRTILGKHAVTDRLVDNTGMGPDELAEVIGGYFADVVAGAAREPEGPERQLELFGDVTEARLTGNG